MLLDFLFFKIFENFDKTSDTVYENDLILVFIPDTFSQLLVI